MRYLVRYNENNVYGYSNKYADDITYTIEPLNKRKPVPTNFTDDEKKQINFIIKGAIKSLYGSYNFRGVYKYNNKLYNWEYISKFTNNNKVRDAIFTDFNLSSLSEFNRFIKKYGKEILHTSGRFFNIYYSEIERLSAIGLANEIAAFKEFEIYSKSMGFDFKIVQSNVDEDVNQGIDGYFFYNDRKVTIQVKTFTELSFLENKVIFVVNSDIKEIKTDYLILSNIKNIIIIKKPVGGYITDDNNKTITVTIKDILYTKNEIF